MGIEAIKERYAAYEQAAKAARQEAAPLDGAFGIGDDPKKDPCHKQFYKDIEEMSQSFPKEEAAQIVRWMLEYPARHRGGDTYWFTYAAQKFTLPLVPVLDAEEARTLLTLLKYNYPQQDWLPVQKEVAAALRKQGGSIEMEKQKTTNLWIRRVLALLVGLTIAHLGVTLFLLADLGSDPFNVMIQGLYRVLNKGTHGTVHVAVSFLIIMVLLIVDRSYVRIGTFLCMILGGPIIDVFTLLLGGIVNGGSAMAVRVIAVVLGCGILAFGMTIVIKSEAGTGPNDLVAVVISDKTKWKFGLVRIAVDLTFAVIGFVLGGTVGLGTIVCAAVVGPVAQVMMPISQRICEKILDSRAA